MSKPKDFQKIIDDLRNAAWRTEGLSELFMSLGGHQDIDITPGAVYGAGLILEDIKKIIDSSSNRLESSYNQASWEKKT